MAGWQLYFTLAVLALEVAAFASNRIRLDVTVLLGCYALVLAKIVSAKEALAGFGDTTTLMITSTFVLGMGIQNSGLADEIAMVLKKGTLGKQWLFMLELMLISAGLSAFMSNTGTVAIMLPIALSTIKECNWPRRPFLMALGFASSLGGCLTVIGTPPNMVVNDYLFQTTGKGLSFFGFTPIGIVCLIIGVGYMCTVGWWILDRTDPARGNKTPAVGTSVESDMHAHTDTMDTVAKGESQLPFTVMKATEEGLVGCEGNDAGVARASANDSELRLLVASITKEGKLCGKRFCDLGLHSKFAITVLAVVRGDGTVQPINFLAPVAIGDCLYLRGTGKDLGRFETAHEGDVRVVHRTDAPINSVLFVPTDPSKIPSELAIRHISFSSTEGCNSPPHTYLMSQKQAKTAQAHGEVYGYGALNVLKQLTLSAYSAMLCMVLVVVFMFFEKLVPNVTVMMLGATLMCMLGCMSAHDAYRAIHWESVVLIAGMIPMSTALQQTGAIDAVVSALGELGQTTSPLVVLTVLFVIATFLTQVISNTATAILIAPVAAQCAVSLSVSPTPFLVGLAVAASCAFMTPVGSPTNVLVMAPGGYSFMDYVVTGSIMQVLLFGVCVALIPVIYPF